MLVHIAQLQIIIFFLLLFGALFPETLQYWVDGFEWVEKAPLPAPCFKNRNEIVFIFLPLGRLIFDNLKKSIAYTLTNNIHEMTKTIKEDLGFVRLKQTLQDLNSNVPFSCCTCAAP